MLNWKTWLTFNPYKKLWFWAGRPFTFIIRDFWNSAEIVMQFVWFFTGIAVYIWQGWLGVLLFIIFYTYGYLNGHIFFGTDWIKGQKGD